MGYDSFTFQDGPLQYDKDAYERIKKDMMRAFSNLGLSEQDQLWHMHEDPQYLNEMDQMAKNTIYLSKHQYRNVLIDLGMLQDFNRMTPKIH